MTDDHNLALGITLTSIEQLVPELPYVGKRSESAFERDPLHFDVRKART
jgi:hypothetical protein